jgi:Helix-turn-helix domain
MKSISIDAYICQTLLRDLVGHDRKPAAFLLYLWLYAEQRLRSEPVEASYATLAEETGLSRSTAQSAVGWLVRRRLVSVKKDAPTATPIYSTHTPWLRSSR